ncbi:hypothetical protein NUH86_15725 [Sphingobium sp. JS3065]|uniref:hypothetical protein n=1 Tax=Sphingobium sp. JS3065 TaxID=2970925 RepID=UPI00226540A7|nr:hypothetical protein [Sphingobium sp. JS3065]UZW54904.1 hypothetical protein NUH86_15725 [Sphingobium sp. JS3065]
MTDPVVGAVIVQHIDELEAALRYARRSLTPMLEKATAAIIDERRKIYGWEGEAPTDFDDMLWLAPAEWRMAGDADDGFDLYLSFSTTDCIDGEEPDTWVGYFCGFAGATIRFEFATDAIGQRDWKAVLRAQTKLAEGLVDQGFLCDPKTGELALRIPVDREALAIGFEDNDLEAALAPVAKTLDRIRAARALLDELVTAIREKSSFRPVSNGG